MRDHHTSTTDDALRWERRYHSQDRELVDFDLAEELRLEEEIAQDRRAAA